jgi:hypothetical protein
VGGSGEDSTERQNENWSFATRGSGSAAIRQISGVVALMLAAGSFQLYGFAIRHTLEQ